MNSYQKRVLTNFTVVIIITVIAVVAIVIFRDWVNRSEATRAMEHLGKTVLEYRKERGLVPPESYINDIKKNLTGYARLGKLYYRALWIDYECTDDEILAYAKKTSRSLFTKNVYIVLRLDGRVEWMEEKEFNALLAQQQEPAEVKMMKD